MGATLNNNGNLNNEFGAMLENNAQFNNAGTVTIAAGSSVEGTGIYTQTAGSTTIQGLMSQGSITIQGGQFVIASGATAEANFYTQTAGSTTIDNGTLDPTAVKITGGSFGGTGTVIGNVTVNAATLQVGLGTGSAGSAGALHIAGNYLQSGGSVVFEIDPNGTGGFAESTLLLDPGHTTTISNANVVFDFLGGANPLAFYKSGDFNSNTFFTESAGSPLSAAALTAMLTEDTYSIESSSYDVTSFAYNPATGATGLTEGSSTVAVPEIDPASAMSALGLLLGSLAVMRGRRIVKPDNAAT